MRPDLRHNLLDSVQKTLIVHLRLTDAYAVLPELPRLARKTRGMGQRSDWHRAIVRGHAANRTSAQQGGSRTQLGGTERGYDSGWTGAHYCHVHSVHDLLIDVMA